MGEDELNEARNCISNIQDKLDSLRLEVNCKTPYPRYCLEKLEPIRMDVNCLIAIFESKLIKNDIRADQSN